MVNRTVVPAVAAALSAISLALFTADYAFAQDRSCEFHENSAVPPLKALMRAVQSNDYANVRLEMDKRWSKAPALEEQKQIAAVNLGRMSLHSGTLAQDQLCTQDESIAFGRYRNSLTGAIDEVEVHVSADPQPQVVKVRVRPAKWFADDPVPRSEKARVNALDAYVQRLVSRDAFSGVVLIARHGKPIYVRTAGFANKELRVPNSPDTPMNLASLNKIMTAVAVMQLVEDGRLSLEDNFADLLPKASTNTALKAVKVKHLLSHTSGIIDNPDKLKFSPGTKYEYSNANFRYLGEIIEAKSHMRYEDYMRLRIFGPTGMASTSRYELKEMSPLLTYGYTLEHLGKPADAPKDRLQLTPNHYLHIYPGWAMGAYWSTANDMLRFANALEAGRLVKRETVELMKRPKIEFGATEYGFGVMRWRGPAIWGHAGDLPGTDADLEFYGNGYTAIVLANYDTVNDPILQRIRSLFNNREAKQAGAVHSSPAPQH